MEKVIQEGHREGRLATRIESETARLPSDVFLWAAIGAIGSVHVVTHCREKTQKPFLRPMGCAFFAFRRL
ncbi:MAG: hypothetical protein ACTHM5_20965 [Ginsengibacter sp.]